MVTRWLTTGYEIPFFKVPRKPLCARNNKSCVHNLDFAREELQRQVNCGILSEVPYEPLVVYPISCVYSNKWRLVVDCRLLNPYVAREKLSWQTFVLFTPWLVEVHTCLLTTLKKDIGK